MSVNRLLTAGLNFPPTFLKICPKLARRAAVGQVLVKNEGERPLGNFKVLGGMCAGLKALAREVGVPVGQLRDHQGEAFPRLICASDGNHGLAVAAGARWAGAPATIYIHTTVQAYRIARIEALGARVAIVKGTYDDAVAAAAAAARRGKGLLIPDTSDDPNEPVVREVMKGYAVIADELKAQLRVDNRRPTHIFVQAGVGGLAATMAQELGSILAPPRNLVVVEPNRAACVAHAMRTGRIERIPGDLHSAAEMLSCGVASAYAIQVLSQFGALPLPVDEAFLVEAVHSLREDGDIESTPSGAAGLAGLLCASTEPELRRQYGLNSESVVLLVATEAPSSQLCRKFAVSYQSRMGADLRLIEGSPDPCSDLKPLFSGHDDFGCATP